MSSQDDRYRAPALDKGLDIVELLAHSPLPLTQVEIAKDLGRSPNEIYRMLSTLVRRGYVSKVLDGEGYQLSLKLFTLAHRHPPIRRLLEQALPLMRRASRAAQQSFHIGVEQDGQIVIVASVDAPGNWGLALRIGSIIGLYNTGTGRVLAAYRSAERLERLVAGHTLADGEPAMPRPEFEAHLERIRRQGYERMPSGTTVGVTNIAYPILGPDGGAIAVMSSPYLERIDAHVSPDIAKVEAIIAELARKLSVDLSTIRPETVS